MASLGKKTPAQLRQPAAKKRKLPPPITLSELGMELVIHCCRQYLLVDPSFRLGVYCVVLTLLSIIGELAPLPRNFYFAKNRNILNDYFVKWGLLWTLSLLVPFVYNTAKVYSGNNARNIRQQMARLIVAFFVWFVATRFFSLVNHLTGFCTKTLYFDQATCSTNGGRWFSFDISGHTFLLIYCSLVISEECRVFRNWDRIRELLRNADLDENAPELILLDEQEKLEIQREDVGRSFHIRVFFFVLTLLTLLWDYMLFITSIYFHTWPQKVIGLAVAAAAWYVTYGWWYRQPFSPGMPGHCKLKYISNKSK